MNINNYRLIKEFAADAISNKEKKKIESLKKYFNENSDIREVYYAYENLKSGVSGKCPIEEFIKINLKVISEGISKEKVLPESKSAPNKDEQMISMLAESYRKPSMAKEFAESYTYVYEKIHENNERTKLAERKPLVESQIRKLAGEDFYDKLSKSQNSKEFFESYKLEAYLNITSLIETEKDETVKLQLFEARDKIGKINYDPKTFAKKTAFLHGLKKSINEQKQINELPADK